MPASLCGRFVLGIKVEHIRHGGQRACWGPLLTGIIETFMVENEDFLAWKLQRNVHVTETSLRSFPLEKLYPLIGASGLEDVKNIDGRPVLPVLDDKIRRKMAMVFKNLSNKDQLIMAPTSSPVSQSPAQQNHRATTLSPTAFHIRFNPEDIQTMRNLISSRRSSSASSASSASTSSNDNEDDDDDVYTSQDEESNRRKEMEARWQILVEEETRDKRLKAELLKALESTQKAKEEKKLLVRKAKGKGVDRK